MKTEIFTAHDGKAISLKIWDAAEEPRGVVQLVHGMAEHVSRYNDFAEYMNAAAIPPPPQKNAWRSLCDLRPFPPYTVRHSAPLAT